MTTICKTIGDERRDDESMTAFTMRRIRNEIIEECASELETSYPDHAWLNAACAAIRSLRDAA